MHTPVSSHGRSTVEVSLCGVVPPTMRRWWKTLSKLTIDTYYYCAEPLKKECGDDQLTLSVDAGRYVCNYTYYASLKQAQKMNHVHVHPIFVHIPLFSKIDEETQFDMVKQIIKSISEQLTRPPNH